MRFHAVYWPAFLMSAGIAVPRRVFSHGFLFNRGEKMSKSVGNVVDPFALADAYGVDQLRYFFLREVPFGQDGNYSHEAIVNRINADLANDLGNLAQRSLSMIGKNCGGVLPKPGAFSDERPGDPRGRRRHDRRRRASAMKTQQLHQVLNAIWAVVADANRYFAGEAPWALAKTDPARQGTVLYVTAEVIRQVGDPVPAVHAGVGGQAARPARRAGGRARLRPARRRRHAHRAGHGAAGARAGVPALRRAGSRRRRDRRCWSTATAISISRTSRDELDGVVARARGRRRRPHGDDLDARAAARADRWPSPSAFRRCLLLGRHASASRPRGARHRRGRSGRAARAIPRWWRSARRGSTITTTTARATRRSRASAPTSRRRARPACRW